MTQAFRWALPVDAEATTNAATSTRPAPWATRLVELPVQRAVQPTEDFDQAALLEEPETYDETPTLRLAPPIIRATRAQDGHDPAPSTKAVRPEVAPVEAQRQLSPSREFTAGVAAAFAVTRSPLALVQSDELGTRLVSINPSFTALTGWAAEQVIGGPALPIQGPRSDPAAVATLAAAIDRGDSAAATMLCQRQDGSCYWAAVTVKPVGSLGSPTTRLLVIEQHDLTRELRAEAEQWRARNIDPVTGSAGRGLVDQAMAEHVAAQRPFGVVLVRVEGVEKRNSDGGYGDGDAALARAADRLATALAGRGRIARHVGTHFAVVVDHLGADGRSLTHTLAEDLESAGRGDGLDVYAGTALYPLDADTPAELLGLAKAQLEVVKRQGASRLGRLRWRLSWALHRES